MGAVAAASEGDTKDGNAEERKSLGISGAEGTSETSWTS